LLSLSLSIDLTLKTLELSEIKQNLNTTENQLDEEAIENSISLNKLIFESDELEKRLSEEDQDQLDMSEIITGLEGEYSNISGNLEMIVATLEQSHRDASKR
jgi:hypothetical protein